MVEIKTKEFIVNAPIEKVHAFLSETKNYVLILPKEQISDFQFSTDQFSFKAAGQVTLTLVKGTCTLHELQFNGMKGNPFVFNLLVFLDAKNEHTSGHIQINAELNMMFKMLIEKPLHQLLAKMAENLSKQLG